MEAALGLPVDQLMALRAALVRVLRRRVARVPLVGPDVLMALDVLVRLLHVTVRLVVRFMYALIVLMSLCWWWTG